MTHKPRRAALSVLSLLLFVLLSAPSAQAEFGLSEFDVAFANSEGAAALQAGSHPFEMTSFLHYISVPTGEGGETIEESPKDILVAQMPGLVGNPTAVPRCESADFLSSVQVDIGEGSTFPVPDCPVAAAVGTVGVSLSSKIGKSVLYGSVYNLVPPPGAAAMIGFSITGVRVALELSVEEDPPHNILATTNNTTQLLEVLAADVDVWGVPADPAHDSLRGVCFNPITGESIDECEAGVPEVPFLTMPRACSGPLKTTYRINSWQNPSFFAAGFAETHDAAGNPAGINGCGKLGFEPEITARPTSKTATSPSGLDFSLDTKNPGLDSPDGISNADVDNALVTLPKGFTANPALAEGLEVCTEAQLDEETAFSAPGAGCPQAAKIGSLEVETPILEDQILRGSLFIAEPYENPFGSLLALYMVIQDPELGVVVKVPLRVTPDPVTGQLVTVGEDLPPFPFSHFRLHFREGGRSPLITPPGCGTFEVKASLHPSSGGAPVQASSAFEIVSGPNGSTCPAGPAPFKPGFEAGTNNNQAGSYSPFYMRLTRGDGEQDLTRFSAVLPPGVVGKIAGIPFCSEASIARAKSRTGEHGGSEELADPSCPQASKIGRTLAGAGVGSQLAYVPGSLYLAGPYAGDPLSVVAITPAVAGPFDAGTVVVRQALTLNPVTGEVEADGAASDPIPHILQGIPLNVRDLRVYVDRPQFTLNATSCEEESSRAILFGGGTLLAPTPDTPAGLSSRYQAAECAALGFRPKLAFKLKGGTRRGDHPALKATYTPRAGDANLEGLVVRLPRSAFLDQAHIRTICTRVQFAADACPAGAQYGTIKATTPLLDEPLQGPVWLRSSDHNLPDLVFDLQGLVDVEVATRIDSVRGGIRASIEGAPDAPITKVELSMQGGKKGLIVNSRNLCAKVSKASVQFAGQNGRTAKAKPVMRAVGCPGKGKASGRRVRAR